MTNLDADVKNWGLIPAEFGRYLGMTFLTSFFLHGGLFHLIGNLYFLVVFGDNTEDVLGKRRFLLLLAAVAMAGNVLHILADPRATLPCVGASGGISSVLAYYCLATRSLMGQDRPSQALLLRRRRRCFCLRILSAFRAAGLFSPRVRSSSSSHIRLRA